jgi:hypothetical protein
MARHPWQQVSMGRSVLWTSALILFAASALASDLTPPAVEYRYATLRSGTTVGEARTLRRTAILYGPTEFFALPRDSDRMTVDELIVLGGPLTAAGPPVLCRSSRSTPNRCTADLGDQAVGRRLTLVSRLWDTQERNFRLVRTSLATLAVHPDPARGLAGAVLEYARADEYPSDSLRRLVLAQRRSGERSDAVPVYADDLTIEQLEITVSGVDGARVVDVRQPSAAPGELAVPLFLNVAPYLRKSSDGPVWRTEYPPVVEALVGGLREAAARGVDIECLVVQYAATGRLFPPFRLHAGADLSDDQRATNEATLAELQDWLVAPPPEAWLQIAEVGSPGRRLASAKVRNAWKSDFVSSLNTLNDLYLREHRGKVAVVLITDGSTDRPATAFQVGLWPRRLEELNRIWPQDRLARFYRQVDQGLGTHDEQLSRFIEQLDPEDPSAARKIAAFLSELDPGGTTSLQAHRTGFAPHINALLVGRPNVRSPANQAAFSEFIKRTYGGRIWQLFNIKDVGAQTVADVVQATARELQHAHVVTMDVPNPDQDGGSRAILLKLRDRPGQDIELHYMPYHFSSRPLSLKISVYLASPFKNLRMLSAHALRRFPFDEQLYRLAEWRRAQESDPQVQELLFESWLCVELQRLQAYEDSEGRAWSVRKRRRAYKRLTTVDPGQFAHSDLALRARRVAEWYAEDHPAAITRRGRGAR